MHVRRAKATDSEALLALTARTPMQGTISLRIDRNPDFFRLLRLRGTYRTLVASLGKVIVGSVSLTYRNVFVNGVSRRVGYVCDLKVDPAWSGSRAALRLMQAAMREARSIPLARLYFCVIADGNRRTISLLQGRLGIPRFESIGRFYVYEIVPLPVRSTQRTYSIRKAGREDLGKLCGLINVFHRGYQFGMKMSPRDLSRYSETGTIFVAERSGTSVATLSIHDTSDAKQNVVLGMPLLIRLVVGTVRAISKLVPFPKLPAIGEPIRMQYISNIACKADHEAALAALFRHARHEAFRQGHTFLAIGLHERDPVRRLIRPFLKFTFISHGFVASLTRDSALISSVRSGIPFEDYSLV